MKFILFVINPKSSFLDVRIHHILKLQLSVHYTQICCFQAFRWGNCKICRLSKYDQAVYLLASYHGPQFTFWKTALAYSEY